MKDVILALDQGTTSSRAIAVNADGKVVASAQREFPQHYPKPGWVEHDPREILDSQLAVMDEVLEKTGGARAIGITNQRETTVLWDRETGEAVHPAIVWQDRRTADMCRGLADYAGLFASRTGLRLDPYFAGTKLRWLLENLPNVRQRAEAGELAFGTVDSWLVWHLTGGKHHLTDATNASRTLLFDIHRQCWDDELLRILDIPKTVLPEVVDSSGLIAETTDGLPIAGIAGDQHAALFGQGCYEPGMAKNTYGTGCFLLMHTGAKPVMSANRLLTTMAWRIDGKPEYALEGSVFIAGALVQWLRDEMGLISTSEEVGELAATVADSHGLVIVPAFAGLGAPHWDPQARGLAIGLTRGVNKAHWCRAALESIAFQSGELVRCMERDAGHRMAELKVDGGATMNDLLMQIQADLCSAPVVRPKNIETTAMGAAFLAGLGVGMWKDRREILAMLEEERRFEPREIDAAAKWRDWDRAVERAKAWE
ncbi:glycerol kinase GlpK [Haloferula sargassicola]|uniref:Glycerol kinase n=1 Tax=Haloferula sargassicola TaxID=490096 RepID=A0ABP9UNA8_9BACT